MIKLETFLIEKGYVQFALNIKTMKFYKPTEYVISSMVNLCHYYYPKDDLILEKIKQGISISENGINWYDRKNEIVIGLHEANKPFTLICPRPRIISKSIIEDKIIINNELSDDIMNIALIKFDYEKIFEAMYNKEIILKINGNNN